MRGACGPAAGGQLDRLRGQRIVGGVGAEQRRHHVRLGDHADHAQLVVDHGQVMQALRAHFKPEFLNRVDDIIFFNPLGKEQLVKIVDLRLRDLEGLLAGRKIGLELTAKAKELIFTEGYDAAYGARPLKRAIQRLVQDPLAMKILDGEVLHGDRVKVDVEKGAKLRFSAIHQEAAEPVAAK